MELQDLSHDERLALVALMEWVVKSDVRFVEDEAERLRGVVGALGEDTYQALADEVFERFANDEDLEAFLPSITRQEARDLIYETVLEVAMADAIDVRESDMLDRLRKLWGIEIRFDDGGTDT